MTCMEKINIFMSLKAMSSSFSYNAYVDKSFLHADIHDLRDCRNQLLELH